jgi:hypothetical protein
LGSILHIYKCTYDINISSDMYSACRWYGTSCV